MSAETPKPSVPILAKFVIGGISGMTGQAITHPMDLIKIHLQIERTSAREAIQSTFKEKGIRGFYVGLSSALLRQVTYTTTRLGTYTTLLDLCQNRFGRLNYLTMVSLGMFSGIVGAFVGTPADLIMIRVISDMKLPPEKRTNYGNAISALMYIARNEGVLKLWTGAVSTMGRAAIVNGAQLGTYSKAKYMLEDTGLLRDGLLLQFLAAMISGLVMCVVSLPVDALKTRIQSASSSKMKASNSQIFIDLVRKEGVKSLWRGFLPYYARAAPVTVLIMTCTDQLNRLYIERFQ